MTDLEVIKNDLKKILSEKRFEHSLAVAKQAVILAETYGVDKNHAYIAGLVHDTCKELSKNEQLKIINESGIILSNIEKNEPNIWHGYAASGFIRNKWGIDDDDIGNAVKNHTCGRKNMSTLEKIIFIADLTSEDRNYPDSKKIREISYSNLDEAIYNCYLYIIPFILNKKGNITQNTIDSYNDAIINMKRSEKY